MAYIGKSPTGAGVRSRFFYTQTSAGSTSISGNDDDNRTLTFSDAEYVDVYLNGSLLAKGDYTAASNTISGLAALASGDIVEVVVYDIFSVADTVSASQGGTFNASVTIADDLTVDTNTLHVDSTNNLVGIGTAAPSAAMHIISGSDNANTLLLADTTTDSTIVDGFVTSRHATSAEEPVLMMQGRSTGSENIVLIGGTHNNTTYNTATSIRFFTASSDTSTTPSERMRINSSGYVGIGGTPDKMLTLEANNNGTAGFPNNVLRFKDSDTTTASDQAAGAIEWHTGDTDNGAPGVVGKIEAKAEGTGASYGLRFYTGNVNGFGEAMRINSDQKVCIGTTSVLVTEAVLNCEMPLSGGTVAAFKRNYTSNARQISFVNPNGEVGKINTNGSSTSYNTSSDHRLKQGVEDMTGAIDRVKALAPKRFQFIADADTTVDGFLAHEAQTVVPEAVTGSHNEVDDDGNAVMQGIDQSKLVPLLTAALKEAIAKIETLETRVAALEAAE